MTRSPAAVALVALATFTGCQAPTPTDSPSAPVTSPPSPTPTPSPTCTPEAGGAGHPCTPAQHAAMKEKDALYAEAEAVYTQFHAESVRLSREGGLDGPTEELVRTCSGQALTDIVRVFTVMKERGTHVKGDDPKLSISRLAGRSKAGSVVALSVCTDSSEWRYYRDAKPVAPGRIAQNDVYFAHVDGSLKIIGADGREVESCSSSER